jgi:hypothetical protein
MTGGYRFHLDLLAASDSDRYYHQKCDKIIASELKSIPQADAINVFRGVLGAAGNIPEMRGLSQLLAWKSLYEFAGPDLPPVVGDRENKWVIRKGMRRTPSVPR